MAISSFPGVKTEVQTGAERHQRLPREEVAEQKPRSSASKSPALFHDCPFGEGWSPKGMTLSPLKHFRG